MSDVMLVLKLLQASLGSEHLHAHQRGELIISYKNNALKFKHNDSRVLSGFSKKIKKS